MVGPTFDPEELAGRKLTALFDRAAARDFADVFVLAQRFVVVEMKPSSDDVGRRRAHRLALCISVRAEANECFGDGNVESGSNHPGRLMNLRPDRNRVIEPWCEPADR